MKRDIIFFVSNIVALFTITGIIIGLSPNLSADITGLIKSVDKISRPYSEIKETSSQISLIISGDDADNNNTAQEEVQDVMNSITPEDSSEDTDLTATPADIQELMAEAEKSIETEKVKGKTSEDNYTGGGTIITFGNVQVQSKIPDSFYNLDIENLLKQKASLEIKDISKPTILIYHSHTTECFTLLDVGYYTESTDLKTKDIDRNMVRVGDEICKVLESKGFKVIHDTEIHDLSYNEAYNSSRKSVSEYLEQYPSIEITIDVHRDSITYKDGTKVKPTAEVNGKKAARMMIISGCEYGSISNYPNWEYNLRFSTAVTNAVNEKYPNLMRPILFSERKYNLDLTKNSFLLEIGTEGNTLDEACYSGRLFANALAELLLKDYVKE